MTTPPSATWCHPSQGVLPHSFREIRRKEFPNDCFFQSVPLFDLKLALSERTSGGGPDRPLPKPTTLPESRSPFLVLFSAPSSSRSKQVPHANVSSHFIPHLGKTSGPDQDIPSTIAFFVPSPPIEPPPSDFQSQMNLYLVPVASLFVMAPRDFKKELHVKRSDIDSATG